MNRITERQKRWQHTRRVKTMRYRHRQKSIHKKTIKKYAHKPSLRLNKDSDGIVLKAPVCFSLLENKNETILYFAKALEATKICEPRQRIFFDLSDVEFISADAIMYLIALVNNVKRCQLMHITCGGNLPNNTEARDLLTKTGFYDHVKGNKPTSELDTSKRIQITSGNNANGKLIGEICEFIGAHTSDYDRVSTKPLYTIFIELMTNTVQHAYRANNAIMDNKWFVYVEDVDDCVKFVFLDTGAGIPSTIRRNFGEKIKQRLLRNRGDAKLIESALIESFRRSETREEHRSKGLPNVYEVSKDPRIDGLTIISGKGECRITDNGTIEDRISDMNFVGTLFCWTFQK